MKAMGAGVAVGDWVDVVQAVGASGQRSGMQAERPRRSTRLARFRNGFMCEAVIARIIPNKNPLPRTGGGEEVSWF
jgi:hypothetical protein